MFRKLDIDWSAVLLVMLVGILVLLLTISCVALYVTLRAEKLCLQHGWKDAKVTWDLTAYCMREENEYEIVKPLAVIMEKE